MIIQGRIDTIAFGGRGILRDETRVIFVPFTAPGDLVQIELTSQKKRYGEGRLKKIITPSLLRTPPVCPYFEQCGGCQFQHITYEAQLEIKRKFIEDALQRIGSISFTVAPIIPSQLLWNYRNHIRLKIFFQAGLIGYIGADHHAFIAIDECAIFQNPSHPIFTDLQTFLKRVDWGKISSAYLRIFALQSNDYLMVFYLEQPFTINTEQIEQELKTHPSWAGMIFALPHETISVGQIECRFTILDLQIQFSPFGFVQNHLEQSRQLYQFILDHIPEGISHALDLYCGIGITALLLARKGINVIGVESHLKTVEIAQENARSNRIDSVKFYCGKAETLITGLLKNHTFDLVLLNPPRTGLDPQLITELMDASPTHLMYVSCMPSTLARDLNLFLNKGYQIVSVQGFDLFPQTTHIETVVILKKSAHQN